MFYLIQNYIKCRSLIYLEYEPHGPNNCSKALDDCCSKWFRADRKISVEWGNIVTPIIVVSTCCQTILRISILLQVNFREFFVKIDLPVAIPSRE